MKKKTRKKRLSPRLPIGIVLRLGSRPMTARKGDKGYSRKQLKTETKGIIREEIS